MHCLLGAAICHSLHDGGGRQAVVGVQAVELFIWGAAEVALEALVGCSFRALSLHDPELPIDRSPSGAIVRLGSGVVPCKGLHN